MSHISFTIWPPYEVFYVQSMLFNTASAVASITRLGELFENCAADPDHSLASLDENDVLNHSQNIVLQAAALSRYFWPVRKHRDARAALLRQACNVEESSALRSRDLRNAIEHFDEKLDDYLAGGISGWIVPQYVGPFRPDHGMPVHLFRAYYTDIGVFELLGKHYELQPVADEICRIHAHLVVCDKNGGRLRRSN